MFKDKMPFCFDKEGSGGGGNAGGGGEGSQGETVSKADYDKLVGELEAAKKETEDTRLEIMTPEYTEFLESKEKGGKVKSEESTSEETDFSKLTPKQIYEKAVADAEARVEARIKKSEDDRAASTKEATQKEIAAFARSHDDFEQFRPLMYGLSLDPKNKDYTLQELYNAAKEHVQRIHTGPTDDEKGKSRKATGEKPGSSTPSFDKDKKYTPEEAAKEAWDEVVGSEGLPRE